MVYIFLIIQAPTTYLVEYPHDRDSEGNERAHLGLRFQAQKWHFLQGEIHLRCNAVLHRYVKDVNHKGRAFSPFHSHHEYPLEQSSSISKFNF